MNPVIPDLIFIVLGAAATAAAGAAVAAAATAAVVTGAAGVALTATGGVAAAAGAADEKVGTVVRVLGCLGGGGVDTSNDVLRLLARLAACCCCDGGATTEAVTGMAMSGSGLTGAMGEYTVPGGGVVDEETADARGVTEGWEGGPGLG